MKRMSVLAATALLLFVQSVVRADVPQGVNLAAMQGWDIVVAKDGIPSEYYAAEEFRDIFQQASGVRLPIVHETLRPDQHVFIGPSKAMRKSDVGFDVDGFGSEDLRIVVRSDNIAIAGGRPRGTLYGVYTFLEEYVGVRFLTADHTHVPAVGSWKMVEPVDRSYRPPFGLVRWTVYGETLHNSKFTARTRGNIKAKDGGIEERHGGSTQYNRVGHSFYRLLPSQKYGLEHPEYYALINGQRQPNIERNGRRTQPCLTNPRVLRLVTQATLDWIDKHPQWKIVSVAQNDNKNYCRCEQCAAIDQREGSHMGALLTFVNQVADEVGKQHPDMTVGTFAYRYSRQAPKTIRPRPNVQVQLSSIECCTIHPIDDPDCPRNVQFVSVL